MRQSIRGLGWAVTISTLLLFVFLITAVYSVFQTLASGRGIGFGELQLSFSDNRLVLSMPVTVNNTGYYDVTDFEIKTMLRDSDDKTLASSSSVIEEIKKGSTESRSHNLSISLTSILSNVTNLLFRDTEFRIDLSVTFRYAYALGFNITMTNMSVPWGAPLYGLDLKEIGLPKFNGTHLTINIVLEVENHSFFDVNGNFNFKIYNKDDMYIGSGRGLIDIPRGSRLSEPVEIVIQVVNPLDFTGEGYLEVYLELPLFTQSIEMGRLYYG